MGHIPRYGCEKSKGIYTLQTTIIPFLLFVRKVGQVREILEKIPLTVMIRVKKVFAIMEIMI